MKWWLLAAIGLAGCKDKAGSGDDTGDPGDPGDSGDTADSGDTDDSGDSGDSGDTGEPSGDLWEWCPSPEEAVGTGSEELIVADTALYCALGHGPTLAEELANHVQLRLVPGTYALPGEDGTSDYALPVCLRGEDPDVPSALGDPGELTATSNSSIPYSSWYLGGQTLTRDGEEWSFGFSLTAFPQGGQMPDLVLDDELRHGDYPDTEAYLTVCRGDCLEDQRYVFPCEPKSPADEPTLTVTFDRGSLSVYIELASGAFGPSVPAVFYRAEGTLDGAPFAQDSYWEMAHMPDHHNKGGGFLVRFPAPLSGACGLIAEIPSSDGSFYFKELRAATIDCDGAELEELAGTAVVD